MEFWNEFSNTVRGAASHTVKGAEKLSNIAKIKYKISSVNDKLDICYKALGELYYNEKCGKEVQPDMYRTLLDKIDALRTALSELEGKLAELRSHKICHLCGSKIQKSHTFCPKCGEKVTYEDD